MGIGKLFGAKAGKSLAAEAVEDAKEIQSSVNFELLVAAWDEYTEIKKRDPRYDPEYLIRPTAWLGLSKVIEYEGDFSRFTAEEQPMLFSLKRGFIFYSDVLHVLIDHHDDAQAGEELFAAHPDVHDLIPPEYDNAEHVIEVIIEVIRDYQWQLEHFYLKHKAAIDAQLEKLPTAQA